MTLRHMVADVFAGRIEAKEIDIEHGRIVALRLATGEVDAGILIPGLIDAHVHIESSMLPPSEFARVAVRHGTVGTVSDPHEIANVLGVAGIDFMLRDARRRTFQFCFGCPSCVPATAFETSGSTIDALQVADILKRPAIHYLSEMMNWTGVLHGDPEVFAKIAAAKALGKPVDGHAPQLMGADAAKYIAAGMSTDHECATLEEARAKARLGMKILIREGSAARNFEALWPIVLEYPHLCMFCTDDAHPDMLLKGHINVLVARAVKRGVNVFAALRCATVNPIEHYKIGSGLLRVGDRADMVLVNDMQKFRAMKTWIAGELVADNGQATFTRLAVETPNRFRKATFTANDFCVATKATAQVQARVIVPHDGELVTSEAIESLAVRGGVIELDTSDPRDIAFLAVINRYTDVPPAVAFIRGLSLGEKAIAASVAHDSHNVVVAAGTRHALAKAANAVFQARGGLVLVDGDRTHVLSLPIAGLMSDQPAEEVGARYEEMTRDVGATFKAPFMTLSFLALLPIPALKLSDLGLFDAREFRFTNVQLDAAK
ncbi:MAG: adenine deaminase [Phycisphaerales bacterium]|nr:adenine deaminase [Phycisphaerales bacterium]